MLKPTTGARTAPPSHPQTDPKADPLAVRILKAAAYLETLGLEIPGIDELVREIPTAKPAAIGPIEGAKPTPPAATTAASNPVVTRKPPMPAIPENIVVTQPVAQTEPAKKQPDAVPSLRVQQQRYLDENSAADKALFRDHGKIGHPYRQALAEAVMDHFGIVKVTGDGNCGFYALLAGVIYHALDYRSMRAPVAAQLRRLGTAKHLEVAFGRVQRELNYNNAKTPGALENGRAMLLDLATALQSENPKAALAFIDQRPVDFEQASFVLRAEAISQHGRAKLDPYADSQYDLAPLATTFGGIHLVTISAQSTSQDFRGTGYIEELTDANTKSPRNIFLLHSSIHFDLLLPLPSR